MAKKSSRKRVVPERKLKKKHKGHDQHLCYMIALGLNVTDEQEYQNLVAESHFRCGHCGRTAKSEDNLCVPTRL